MHCQRISGESSCLIHCTTWTHGIHDIRSSSISANRQPRSDNFSKARHIRYNAIQLRSAAITDTEAADYLIENQHDIMCITKIAQALKKRRLSRYHAHISRNRFQDDRSDLPLVCRNERFNRRQIIVGTYQCIFHNIRRNTGTCRHTEGQRPRPAFHKQAIAVTVITAFKFNNFISACKSSGSTDCGHGCFRTGIYHPHLCKTRISLCDKLRQLHLLRCTKTVADSLLYDVLQLRTEQWMRMSQNHRPPGSDIIQIRIPVHIHNMGATGMIDKQTGCMCAGKRTYRRVYSPGHHTVCLLKQCQAFLMLHYCTPSSISRARYRAK